MFTVPRLLQTGAVFALALAVGCQSATPPANPVGPAGSPIAASATVDPLLGSTPDTVPADATPVAASTADQPAVDASPTALPTPKINPTPRPLPSPVRPSQALQPTATGLESKLSAFRTAVRGQDVASSLRLQRELLNATTDAEAALKSDKSPQAQAVRSAIGEIRTGVAGDGSGLDHADASLRQIVAGGTGAGGTLGITVTSDAAAQTATGDLHTLVDDVHNLRQAIQNHNQGDALRLQGQIVNEADIAQKLAASDQSDQGSALRAALASLQKGLDGDITELANAASALDKLDSSSAQTAPHAADLTGLAASLATKLDSFQTASGAGSRGDVLRLQQDILAETAQDVTVLAADHSAQATALRSAIAAVSAGVSGDLDKLAGARADLGKIAAAGGDAGGGATSSTGAASTTVADARPIPDLKRFATSLDNTVASFQDAIQKNDTASMLRLQKQLADQADQADASLKGIQSQPAIEVLSSVAAIRTAFAGDLGKLDDARTHLRSVTGGTSAGPAPGAVATPPTSANPAPFDPQTVAGGLRDKLTTLRDAAQDPHQTPDEVAKRRDALKAEATKAEAALQGITDPRANRLRSALNAAREAAAGDDAKAATALTALDNAINGQ
jgi:hypothetical protein